MDFEDPSFAEQMLLTVNRRSNGYKIQLYKILKKVDNVDPNKFFSFSSMLPNQAI